MSNETIVLASDHGGFELKEKVKDYLSNRGFTISDLGIYTLESVDYPDIAKKAAEKVIELSSPRNILFCGTGIGISIAANRFKGIRCAVVHDLFTAEMAARHNNANFIALGGRVDYRENVLDIIDTYLKHPFEGERHQKRIAKLEGLC